jgi:hypothetical protein
MLRRDLLSLGATLAAGGLAATLPRADAAEEKAESRPGLLAKGVKGTWKGRSGAHGSLTADVLVQHVGVSGGSHTCKVQGRIASPGGSGGLAAFVSQPFTATAEITPARSGDKSCGLLTLKLGPIHLALRGGLTLKLDPIELKFPARGQKLDGRLCALVRLVEGGGSAAEVKAALAEVNGILEKDLITIR